MNKSLTRKIALLIAIIAIGLSLSGCGAVMFSVGAIIDGQKKDYDIVTGNEIASIDSGRTVSILENNQYSAPMKYLGIESLTPLAYESLYENARTQKPGEAILPKIGDSIRISNGVKLSVPVRFDGFTYQYNKDTKKPPALKGINSYYVSISSLSKIETQQVPFDRIGSIISQDSDSLNGNLIHQLVLDGQIPINKIARFDAGLTLRVIQINQIDSLRIKNSKNAKWKLGTVGLVLDVLAATIFVISWNNALAGG